VSVRPFATSTSLPPLRSHNYRPCRQICLCEYAAHEWRAYVGLLISGILLVVLGRFAKNYKPS
jgi:hypothetical protein